jgi:hypothetical protein
LEDFNQFEWDFMMNKMSLFLVSLLFFGNISFSKASDWKQIDEEKGIKVYRKAMPGTDLVAFRGVGVVEASLEKVYFVLLDADHEREWVDRLDKNVILKNISQDERIQYQSFNLPWPVSDRDFVYHMKASMDKEKENVLMVIKSTSFDASPQSVGVRGVLYDSSFQLKKLSGNRTRVDVKIYADPKGLLPKWIVNLLQRSWPLDTLQGIKRQVLKSYTGDILPQLNH